MITVRLGSVMVRNASAFMAVLVLYRKLFVLSARDLCGIMVEEFSSALSVPVTSVKMTSLSTRLLVKFWKQKRTNASRATSMASTLACGVKLAIARITLGVKDLNTNAVNRSLVQNAASKRMKPKILACRVSTDVSFDSNLASYQSMATKLMSFCLFT